MGRRATIAVNNVWYEARMEAAKHNDRLKSREGAAELLGMSVSAVSDAELGLTKIMPVDKAVLMADLYKAPQLLKFYCNNECPIAGCGCLSEEVNPIEKVTVNILKRTRFEDLAHVREKLVDIASDGEIAKDELDELSNVEDYLTELCKTISELKTLIEIAKQSN